MLYDGVYKPNQKDRGEQEIHVNEFIKQRGNFKTMASSPANSGFIKLSATLKSSESLGEEKLEAQKQQQYKEMFNYPINVLRGLREKNNKP